MKTTDSKIVTNTRPYFAWGSRAWSGAAIAGGFALAGLIYGLTEINATAHLEGPVVSEHWVNHWAVVWVSAAVAAIALLAPIGANAWTAFQAFRLDSANDAALREMMRVDPRMRSEFYAMQSRHEETTLAQLHETLAIERNVQAELAEEREPAFSFETKAIAKALTLRNAKRRAVIGYL